MKFLIVLSALAALAAAKPGLGYSAGYPLAHGITAYSAGYPAAFAAAPITSYSSVVSHHAAPALFARAAPAIIAHAAPAVVAHAAPIVAGVKTQYHSQDAFGQASYGHSEPFQHHSAVQDAHGNKVGSFSYVAPNGQVIKTDYVADALGYRVASNALPVGPGAGPAAVHDTPEVVAARAAHLAFHHRGKRGIAVGHTPAATVPLGHAAVVAPAAVSYAAPLAYSAVSPLAYSAYSAPLATSYAYSAPAYAHGYTSLVHSPFHAYLH